MPSDNPTPSLRALHGLWAGERDSLSVANVQGMLLAMRRIYACSGKGQCQILSFRTNRAGRLRASSSRREKARKASLTEVTRPVLTEVDGISHTASQPHQRALSELFDIALSPLCGLQDAFSEKFFCGN